MHLCFQTDFAPRFDVFIFGREVLVVQIDKDAIRGGRIAIAHRVGQIETLGQTLAKRRHDTANVEGARADFAGHLAVIVGHGLGGQRAGGACALNGRDGGELSRIGRADKCRMGA